MDKRSSFLVLNQERAEIRLLLLMVKMKLQFFSIFLLPTSPMSPQMKAKAFASFVDDDDDDEDVGEGGFTLDSRKPSPLFRKRHNY